MIINLSASMLPASIAAPPDAPPRKVPTDAAETRSWGDEPRTNGAESKSMTKAIVLCVLYGLFIAYAVAGSYGIHL